MSLLPEIQFSGDWEVFMTNNCKAKTSTFDQRPIALPNCPLMPQWCHGLLTQADSEEAIVKFPSQLSNLLILDLYMR